MKYQLVYDCDDAINCMDEFDGSWNELQDEIKAMRRQGCYNIQAACIGEEEK